MNGVNSPSQNLTALRDLPTVPTAYGKQQHEYLPIKLPLFSSPHRGRKKLFYRLYRSLPTQETLAAASSPSINTDSRSPNRDSPCYWLSMSISRLLSLPLTRGRGRRERFPPPPKMQPPRPLPPAMRYHYFTPIAASLGGCNGEVGRSFLRKQEGKGNVKFSVLSFLS